MRERGRESERECRREIRRERRRERDFQVATRAERDAGGDWGGLYVVCATCVARGLHAHTSSLVPRSVCLLAGAVGAGVWVEVEQAAKEGEQGGAAMSDNKSKEGAHACSKGALDGCMCAGTARSGTDNPLCVSATVTDRA